MPALPPANTHSSGPQIQTTTVGMGYGQAKGGRMALGYRFALDPRCLQEARLELRGCQQPGVICSLARTVCTSSMPSRRESLPVLPCWWIDVT